MQDPNAAKLSSIGTYLLVALIFNILAVIVWLLETLVLLIVIIGIVLLIPLIISIVTLRRINRMRGAAGRGDIATLKSLNSTGWAIIALIFSGVIPGILLLVANGTINELTTGPYGGGAPTQPVNIPVGTPLEFKYCSSCGTKIAKTATFCPNCGAPQSS